MKAHCEYIGPDITRDIRPAQTLPPQQESSLGHKCVSDSKRHASIPQMICGATAAFLLTTVGPLANATTVVDPANDFIPTFAGAHSPDLDVLSTFATFDGSTFHIGATVNGAVGTLSSALYVFGFDRGAGTSNFAAIGLPGVTFDAVVTMTGTGVLGGRDLVANTPLIFPAGASHIAGSTFTIDVPGALLPSLGRQPDAYGFNLWPRDISVPAGNGQIADFAPDNSDAIVSRVAAVPEPEIYMLFATGLLGIAGVVGRRRSRGSV